MIRISSDESFTHNVISLSLGIGKNVWRLGFSVSFHINVWKWKK